MFLKLKNPIINISTKLKNSAIFIIRLSFGLLNKKIIFFFFKKFFYKKIKPKIINFSFIYNLNNTILDKGVVLYFNKPKSYTGEDLLEYQGHGNIFIINNILKNFVFFLKKYKIKLSKRGEFTRRAFLNNKIDIFELNLILNIFKLNSNNFLKNLNNFFKFNFKKKILKIIKKINNLYFFINFYLNNEILKKIYFYKNFLYNLKYLNIKIFNLLNLFYINKYKKNIIIFGLTNVGKSTFINNLVKNNFSLISSISGTTRDVIKKSIFIENLNFKIFDTPGFKIIYNNNILEYLSLIFSLKKSFFSNIIIYIFDNIIFYSIFFYYIKKNITKNQIIIKILNKIDLLKCCIFLEIFIIKFEKNIILKISSIFFYGLKYLFKEILRNYKKKFNYFDFIFFNIIKKSYKYILKLYLFFYKKKYNLLLNNIIKIKKILNFFIKKNLKNKNISNKIFKNFCIGK
ncbi:GTPase [Candidatus Nasuia deltocephalinicola]|uniref:GTPase n=1 Tax=Candidatus Nasuia deltocephalincola TaxID=1160784 RepID=UPI00216AD73D|nr:GTPase [Candidatus Nasuia deltocephalinicola]